MPHWRFCLFFIIHIQNLGHGFNHNLLTKWNIQKGIKISIAQFYYTIASMPCHPKLKYLSLGRVVIYAKINFWLFLIIFWLLLVNNDQLKTWQFLTTWYHSCFDTSICLGDKDIQTHIQTWSRTPHNTTVLEILGRMCNVSEKSAKPPVCNSVCIFAEKIIVYDMIQQARQFSQQLTCTCSQQKKCNFTLANFNNNGRLLDCFFAKDEFSQSDQIKLSGFPPVYLPATAFFVQGLNWIKKSLSGKIANVVILWARHVGLNL